MNLRDQAREGFSRLPPGLRRRVLHRMGRYAPWEPEFDFTPPALLPGEVAGPPDFVGIGVQKAGTTWWFSLILTHPEVSSRPEIHKERHFFDHLDSASFGSADIDRYHGWFPRPQGTITGEWTPDYVTFPWAPELLRRAAPETRLLLLLRDPVERFRSGLEHHKRMGFSDNAAATANALERGFYLRILDEWLEHFEPQQLLVLQYERCSSDPVSQLQATLRFLGLSEVIPEGLRSPADRPSVESAVDPEVTKRLVDVYEADVAAVAKRLPQIDLALWPNFAYLVSEEEGSGGSNSPT
jgi:Sulfotransferase domain